MRQTSTFSAFLFSSTLFFVLPAAGQGDVLPRWLTRSPGSGSTNYPFGNAAPTRVQYLYEAPETGLSSPRTVTSLEVRAEQGVANAAKTNIDLQISMSQTPILMSTLTSTFAGNHGQNVAVVFSRRMVSLPATTAQTIGSWSPPFLLDAPFTYDPTGGDSLLIDYDVASLPTGLWPVDCAWSAAGVHAAVGTGCNGVTASSTGGQIGGSITFSTASGPANAPGVLFLGVAEWPTPVPVPGSPGCFSFSTLDASLPVTLTGTGTGSVTLPLPSQQSLLGGPLYGQFALVNPSLTLSTSPSRQVFLTDLDNVGRVYNLTSNTSATGTVQTRVAVVTRLQ